MFKICRVGALALVFFSISHDSPFNKRNNKFTSRAITKARVDVLTPQSTTCLVGGCPILKTFYLQPLILHLTNRLVNG